MSRILTLFGCSRFTPQQLPGLALWLDAQDPSTLVKDGSNRVSQWNDKSGNANHAVQVTGGLQPLYVASAINGFPSIQFRDDGSAKLISAADSVSLNYTAFSLFTVLRRHTDVGTEVALGKWSETSPSAQREFRLLIASDDTVILACSAAGTSTNAQPATVSTLSLNSNYILDGLYDGTNVKIAINNGTQASAALASIYNGTSPFHIGARDGASNPAGAYCGEILFYAQTLSLGQRASVLQYLSTKWGIVIS